MRASDAQDLWHFEVEEHRIAARCKAGMDARGLGGVVISFGLTELSSTEYHLLEPIALVQIPFMRL